MVANNRTVGKAVFQNGNSTVNILSSTFVDNIAGGSAAIVQDEGAISVANSIFWGNTPMETLFSEVDVFSVRNSAIEDSDPNDDVIPFGGTANGNIDDLPSFVDRAGNDFHINPGSPTIDAGDDSLLAIDVLDIDEDGDQTEAAPDLDLLDRIAGSSTDMGAFEFFA